MTDAPRSLSTLGDALQRAAAADLSSTHERRRRRRRMAVALLAAAVILPGGAIAASRLIGTDEVERSLPAGTLSLAGTEPTCTVVRQDVEYDCTLRRAPAPAISDWKGTVEPTVDASKHVNGGCRSLQSDGRRWRCYIGREAVRQRIVGAGLLGEYAPAPGVG
jgi:hypothetical protein